MYLSMSSHNCIDKALQVVGMGGCHKRWVDVDADQAMDTNHLEILLKIDINVGFKKHSGKSKKRSPMSV